MVRTGLVDREDERLGNVDMRRPVGGPDDFFSDVLSTERLQTLVHLIGGVLVASESGHAEAGLDHAWLNLGDSDRRIHELLQQRRSEGIYRKLGGAVDGASRVAFSTGDAAEIDDMARVAFFEFSHKNLCKVDETFDVGVDHDVDFVGRDVADFVSAEDETGIIDQDVNVFGPVRE